MKGLNWGSAQGPARDSLEQPKDLDLPLGGEPNSASKVDDSPPVSTFGRRSDRWYIVTLLVSTRLVLEAIGLCSRWLLDPIHPKPAEWSFSGTRLLDLWGVWDSGWYVGIAQTGYTTPASYAFFPFYPLLMRVLGSTGVGVFLAGLIVSNVCLLLSCFLLFELVRIDHDVRIARRAVKYLLLAPMGFVFSGAFTESTYLAATLAALLLVRRDRLLSAGFCGLIASLTRSLGVLLVIPLLIEHVGASRSANRAISRRAGFLLIAPLGLALYSAFLWKTAGDPLAFVHAQAFWGRGLAPPWAVVAWGLRHEDIARRFAAWSAIVAICLILPSWRRLRPASWTLAIYSIVVPISTGLTSVPRYLLPVFPLYVVLATVTREEWADACVSGALALIQGFLMVFWVAGFFIAA